MKQVMEALFGPSSCSREEYLREKDEERQFEKEHRKCCMQRKRSGYARLMNLRYEGKRNEK